MIINKAEILKRIKKVFEGLTQTEIAKICGISQPAVNKYFKKGIIPSYTIMLRIAKYAHVSLDWLLTGEEPRELLASAVREKEAIYEAPVISIYTNAQWKELLQHQISDKDCISIPIISEPIAARDPLTIKEKDIESFAYARKAWVERGHTYICLQVRCNCMHPIISEGFVVAIDLSENNPLKLEHKIVAARYHGSVTIRYLKLTEKDNVLLPLSTADIKPIVIRRTAPNQIIGKVSWWWGKQR